ncbi:MAG: helix-turn-helix transcriptional regulator [Natronomonas sp.]
MNIERGIELTEILVDHHDTLTTLQEEEPLTSQQLEQKLDHSRATINRHLATLREVELVTTVKGKHTLTDLGTIVIQELEKFCHPLHVSARVPELIEQLHSCPIEFEIRMLSGATVTSAVSEEPYQMHERYLGFWNKTERVKGIRSIGAIPPDVVDSIKLKLRADVEVESIWTPTAAAQYLVTYPEIKSLWVEEPNARMLITRERVPVQFGLFDHRIAFTVHDEEIGYPRALVDVTNPAALEWAHDMYDYYLEHSQPLDAWIDTEDSPTFDHA